MLNNFFKNYIFPTATLAGSIIGVGFLSLPYIMLKVGIWPMLFYFVALTVLMVFIHHIFGQISLKTPDHKRFPGFVGYYLGRIPKTLILISETFGLFGVSLVYLIVGGQFLTALLSPWFGDNMLNYVLIYLAFVSVFIYFGAKLVSKIDFLALTSLLIILLIILIKGFAHIKLSNIFIHQPFSDYKTLFLPYGPIMFSLWGVGLIPEVEEMVAGNKKSLKKIIIAGTLISAVFYFLFTVLIISITGTQTTPSALTGLENILPASVIFVALLIGVITTFIAFVAQGLLLKKVFMYDAHIPEFLSWALVCFIPLALFLLGFNSFIPLISFIGGFLLGIDGILIMMIYQKTGGKKIIAYPLILVFILGMAYEIIYFVK